jgi:hypothetical protein
VANIYLQSLVRWFYEEACTYSFLLIGVVSAGRPEHDPGGSHLASGGRDMCEKGD